MHTARYSLSAVAAAAVALALAFGVSQVNGQAPKAPGTVVMTGAPSGGVKFDHAKHVKDAGDKCQTCHHASKPEKPLKSEHQACRDCHAKTATPPMKTTIKTAFHDGMAKKGVCVDCHAAERAKGKKAPAKCPDCHKKENT
jgi:hypothetical protein